MSKFCKICFDSGKIVHEYTSHNVKGRDGKVECPTLLKLRCRLCDRSGHTVKYCTLVNPKQQYQSQSPKIPSEPVKKNIAVPELSKNKYDMLLEDDSEDEGNEVEKEKEQEKEKEKEQEKEQENKLKKRWIDYDSDSDDDERQAPTLVKPMLMRYDRSDESNDSFDEQFLN